MANKAFNEITVEVDVNLERLIEILKEHKFKKIQEYDMTDVYMFERKCDFNRNALEILSDALLIRNIRVADKTINELVYKWKDYNEKQEIIKQAKVSCKVESTNKIEHVLNMVGWISLFEIRNHSLVYVNEKTELVVQIVNDEHIYIEIEDYSETLNKHYSNIDEIKKEFLKYQIPIKNNDFFVKKAEVELLKYLENRK